ncbi:hypothetical protein [Shewanella ulleungensis]|uniref:hypothetical protein n=1 Tax=Shewanella ulleungensis TaxID=2282699 RepID=UPI003D7A02D3
MRQFLTLKLSSMLIYITLGLVSNVQANDSLTLYLTGEIKDKCIIDTQTATSFDFSYVKTHSANLQVDCNQKMSLAIRSDSGGLKLKEHLNSSILVDYSIEVAFQSLNFIVKKNASEMITEQRFNAGNNIPFNTVGTLTLSLKDTFTYSGEYKDTLHIDVYPNFVNNEN